MPNVCILTDSTVQFSCPNFPGHERVFVIPFTSQNRLRPGDESLPWNHPARQLIPPSLEDFIRFYTQLSREFDTIFVLMLSSLLNPLIKHARSASGQYRNHAMIEVIDSQTTGIGLGLLVQAAAAAVVAGAPPTEIERLIRASIPHIFVLFCIPELTFLAHSGTLDYSQALVGELMGMLPVFVIEEGRLSPREKVRTQRHLLETFVEFIHEFDSPAYIALMRGAGHASLRSLPLDQYVKEAFPETPFSEHAIAPHLAALFGPQSTGLVVMEQMDWRCV